MLNSGEWLEFLPLVGTDSQINPTQSPKSLPHRWPGNSSPPRILSAATVTINQNSFFVPLHQPPTSTSHPFSMVNVTQVEIEISWLETLPLTVFTATMVLVYALPLGSWYAWPAPCWRNILGRRWLFFWLLSLGLKLFIPIASALMTSPKAPDPSNSPRMSLSSGNSKSGS